MPIRRIDKTLTATTATIAGEDIAASSIPVKPHIQPGVLQPAVAGKLLDGTTDHSGNYGTAQSDGKSYYYTDIKGSKPIKDPRIGAHFGSQRHKFKSRQLLEQETATHGSNVYSIDGREWIRQADPSNGNANNNNDGTPFQTVGGDNDFWEVTGYFNGINWIGYTYPHSTYGFKWALDGSAYTTNNTASNSFNTTTETPLKDRYVDAGSLLNIPISTTLGIHTFKFGSTSVSHYGCELIAQDTTSTATKSQIQIPAQNVVSYGKKFSVSAATPHYNPFAQNQAGTAVAIGNTTSHGSVATGWAGTGAGYYDDTLDTATSLGLSAWVQNGKYYRPVNGGRVVKWVDSSGNIKTSVNMMPPTGTSIGVSSATNTPEANSWTTQYQPLFSSTTIDHSQAEVAKTFHWREFGNGAANQGNNTSGTLQDASMLSGVDDIAYVMDDGLTSLSANGVYGGEQGMRLNSNPSNIYITFIGTGITFEAYATGGHGGSDDFNWYLDGIELKGWSSGNPAGTHTLAQNLPYGTHIVRLNRVTANTMWQEIKENVTFHQPKKPPIPEDSVVLADYMLMADYVAQTDAENSEISKGVRGLSGSRDVFYNGNFYDSSNNSVVVHTTYLPYGFSNFGSAASNPQTSCTLPFFGSNVDIRSEAGTTAFNGGSNVTHTTLDNSAGSWGDMKMTANPGITLGSNTVVHTLTNGGYRFIGYQIASPIHTSSHYQTFETPFAYELIGGDRNMEQTNLVVTADGKSWDEVTRDTSYLGPKYALVCSCPNGGSSSGATSSTGSGGRLNSIFTDYRGYIQNRHYYNKGIAIGFDSFIILHDGWYEISVSMRGLSGTQLGIELHRNESDVTLHMAYTNNNDHGGMNFTDNYYMKRGERWNARIVSGTFRIQYRNPNLFQVKYLGANR